MRTLRTGLALLLGLLTWISTPAAESGIRVNYSEPLQRLSLPAVRESGAESAGEAALRFQAFGREFDFRLLPNRKLVRALDERNAAVDIDVYRGKIAGIDGSWARFVIADGMPRGMFFDGDALFAVETAADASGRERPLIYRLEDLVIPPGTLGCAHVQNATNANQLFEAVKADTALVGSRAPGATSTMDVGLVADFEFASDKGGGTDVAMITRMNIVDGIFSSQLAVQLSIARIDSFTSANDPFSNVTDSGALLDEVGDFRRQTPEQRAAGLTHLFTGRDLDGTTVGVAYSSALCSTRFGAGLTQGTHSTTVDALIAAHEIGHNFGAPHDGTPGSPCESTPMDFLMAPRINGSDQLSSCSIGEMQDDVAAAQCITALPSTDVAVVARSVPASVFIDDAISVRFDVDSVGTEDATNVTLDVTIPATVRVDAVSATAGSCSTGAGVANCALGTIAGGSGVTVTLDTTAVSAGNASFAANAAADVDANANNNDASSAFSISAAVDLAVLPAAAAQVALNGAVTLRPVLENRSTMAATNVVLTVTPDAGLRIDGVTWAGASCSVDATGVASCQSGNVAGSGSAAVEVRVTGTAEGARSYALAVTADQADRDLSNNDRTGLVTVGTAPSPPSQDDGGSGAFDWLTLLLLPLIRAASRRRAAA